MENENILKISSFDQLTNSSFDVIDDRDISLIHSALNLGPLFIVDSHTDTPELRDENGQAITYLGRMF